MSQDKITASTADPIQSKLDMITDLPTSLMQAVLVFRQSLTFKTYPFHTEESKE
jgi:hypothetical protein